MGSMIVKLGRLKKQWQDRFEFCEHFDDAGNESVGAHMARYGCEQSQIEAQLGEAITLFKAETLDDAVIQLCELTDTIDRMIHSTTHQEQDERAIKRLTYSIYQALVPLMQTDIAEAGYPSTFYPSRDPWLSPEESKQAYEDLLARTAEQEPGDAPEGGAS